MVDEVPVAFMGEAAEGFVRAAGETFAIRTSDQADRAELVCVQHLIAAARAVMDQPDIGERVG